MVSGALLVTLMNVILDKEAEGLPQDSCMKGITTREPIVILLAVLRH